MAVSGAILVALLAMSVSSTRSRLGETDLVVSAVVGAVLQLPPEFSGAIDSVRWYSGETFVAGYSSGFTVFDKKVEHRADLDPTSGSLRVGDWKPSDDGEYSVQINGQALPQKYTVQSTTHAIEGGTLYLDPECSEEIKTMTWSWNGQKLIEWSQGSGETIHAGQKHPGMILDTTTGELTIPNWNQTMDGLYRVSINLNARHREFTVVTAVYAQLGQPLLLDPKINSNMSSIIWEDRSGNWVAVYESVLSDYANYYLSFKDNADLDVRTGKLTIKEWRSEYSGVFSLEANLVKDARKYTVATVKNLDTYPDVRVRYYSGGAAKGDLVCGEMYEGAGVVTYKWRKGNGPWTRGGKTVEVKTDGLQVSPSDYPYDTCMVLSPLGQKEGTLAA